MNIEKYPRNYNYIIKTASNELLSLILSEEKSFRLSRRCSIAVNAFTILYRFNLLPRVTST